MTQLLSPATPSLPARPPFLEAFARLLWKLRACVGEGTAVGMMIHVPTAIPLALAGLITGRLDRLRQRFLALAEKAVAGTLRPPRARARRETGHDTAGGGGEAGGGGGGEAGGLARCAGFGGTRRGPHAPDPLPRRPAWLLRLAPRESSDRVRTGMVAWRLEFERMLEHDEGFRALIASDNRFRRLLRPLMNMLSDDPLPACLRLPPRPRPMRPKRDQRAERDELGAPPGRHRRTEGHGWHPTRPPTPAEPPPTEVAATLAHPAPAPPYGTMTDWTPTELTREPRPAPHRYRTTGPPFIFRLLW